MEGLKSKLAALDFPLRALVLPVLSHPKLDERSPGYSDNVRRYNEILRSTWEHFIAAEDLRPGDDFFAEDGYHLSQLGNETVARVLADRIAKGIVS